MGYVCIACGVLHAEMLAPGNHGKCTKSYLHLMDVFFLRSVSLRERPRDRKPYLPCENPAHLSRVCLEHILNARGLEGIRHGTRV